MSQGGHATHRVGVQKQRRAVVLPYFTMIRQYQKLVRTVGSDKLDNYSRVLSYLGIGTKSTWITPGKY